jgi:subtilisin family serine protease
LTNFGATNVDLSAPGDEVYTTHSLGTDAYAFDQGTSMAAAYASGAAVCLLAARPDDPPSAIIQRLIATVDPVESLAGRCVSAGRLNLRKALGVPLSQPSLMGSLDSAGTALLLTVLGDSGQSYALEASIDLREWNQVSEYMTGWLGFTNITRPISPGASGEFYRARTAP